MLFCINLKEPVLYLCAGEVPLYLWDSVRIHYTLCNHCNVLCAHCETPEADQVPKKGPQWETHLGHSGDIWYILATIPYYQYVTGMQGIVLGFFLNLNLYFCFLSLLLSCPPPRKGIIKCYCVSIFFERWQLSGIQMNPPLKKCK